MITNIPSSFMLTAHRWKVVHVKAINEGDTFGDCDYTAHTIRIAESVSGRTTTQHERLQTFIHEFYHALLQTVGRDDESLVVQLENLTYQSTLTAKYKHDHSRTRSNSQHRNGRGTARARKTADEATDSAESKPDIAI